MTDDEPFPSFFYSKAPLREKVDLITLKNDKQAKFYWMLSLENEFQSSSHKKSPYSNLAPYEDNESEMLDCCDMEDNYEINPTKSGKYITSFYVPLGLQSVIIGPRGSKLKQLQDNTNTLIKVPKPNEEPIVKITGHSERSVASARTQINLLLLSRREKMTITHFVSIPVYSDNIKKNFLKFKEDILKGPSTRGIDETIFQKVEKFHLTLVTLALLDDKEIADAKAMMNKVQNNIQGIFQNRRPQITLKGVEIMNDDPSEVDVLYGKVSLETTEDTEKFQEMANEILDAFYRGGFVRKQYDTVKLHVTLMNSLFRKNDEHQKGKENTGKRESFDATYILNQYKDYYFGKTTLDKIHLSIRFTSSKSGYYESAAIINL